MDFEGWKNPWADLDDERDDASDDGASRASCSPSSGCARWSHDWGRPVQLAIETKHPTRYAGLVERRLVELLDAGSGGHRPRGRRPATGPGHELRLDVAAPGPGVGTAACRPSS